MRTRIANINRQSEAPSKYLYQIVADEVHDPKSCPNERSGITPLSQSDGKGGLIATKGRQNDVRRGNGGFYLERDSSTALRLLRMTIIFKCETVPRFAVVMIKKYIDFENVIYSNSNLKVILE